MRVSIILVILYVNVILGKHLVSKSGPSTILGRFDHGCASIQDNVYVVGGSINFLGLNTSVTSSCEKMTGSQWSTIASMNTERTGHRVVSWNQSLYTLGGKNRLGLVLDSIEVYNPNTNVWKYIQNNMKIPRYFPGVAVSNQGKIYVVGGVNGTSFPIYSMEVFDIATSNWTEFVELPEYIVSSGSSVAILNNLLYVMGGQTFETTPSYLTSMNVYDISKPNSTWENSTSMPVSRQFFSTPVMNNEIFAIGGMLSSNEGPSATVDIFSLKSNLWNFITFPDSARVFACSASIQNEDRIYIIGGAIRSGSGFAVTTDVDILLYAPLTVLAIAGIIVGSIFGSLFIIILIVCLVKARRSRRNEYKPIQ